MKTIKLFAITGIMVALMVTGVFADTQKPVAEVMYGSYGLSWNPNISYAKMVVTVAAPDGQLIKHTFDSGVIPSFDLSELKNGAIEGSYTYELRVIPSLPTNDITNREKPELNKLTTQSSALTQSGSFFVKGGSIVNPNISETPASTMDQVVVDDMIVSGSLCVGIDCVNGESFGFDTIRLRENNLRIKFQDTSNSGSFPTTDWQITANDSTNGGANKFSIDDIDSGRTPFTIEASAPSNSIYVEDSGQVGFGTATPATDLHTLSGNTPTLRLDQDGSSGFTPQVWDIAGNEANFFIRDVTHSGTLPFRIYPGAPSSVINISSDGYAGINNTSPDSLLHVKYTGSTYLETLKVESTNYAARFVLVNGSKTGVMATDSDKVYFGSGGGTNIPTRIVSNGAWKFQVNNDGSLELPTGATCDANGNWTTVSRRNAKENIKELDSITAMDAIKKLNPVTFNYKNDKKEDFVGFIAEDVPELVAKKDRSGLTTMDIVAVLTKVVKEQQKSIEELKEEIKELKKK